MICIITQAMSRDCRVLTNPSANLTGDKDDEDIDSDSLSSDKSEETQKLIITYQHSLWRRV